MHDCIISKHQILYNCEFEIIINLQFKIHLFGSLDLNDFYMID